MLRRRRRRGRARLLLRLERQHMQWYATRNGSGAEQWLMLLWWR
jgi:hypothetical protein